MTSHADPLTVVSAACVAPDRDDAGVPDVAGFIISRFNPLVLEAARRCLGVPDPVASAGERTAVVLASVFGDSTTLDTSAEKLAGGGVPDPLLCYQAVPTPILGLLCREYGITGPVSCLSTFDDLTGELLAFADVLLADEEIDQVVAIAVELSPNARIEETHRRLHDAGRALAPPAGDTAVALLLRRAETGAVPTVHTSQPADPGTFGVLAPLVGLCSRTARPAGNPADPRGG